MYIGVLRLGFAIFWFAMAILLTFRNTLAPEQFGGAISARNLDLGAFLAVALAGWNLVRWYFGRRRTVKQNPIPSRELPDREEEYIPELDFLRPAEPLACARLGYAGIGGYPSTVTVRGPSVVSAINVVPGSIDFQ